MRGVSPRKRAEKNRVIDEIAKLLRENPDGLLLNEIVRRISTDAYAPKDMILVRMKQMRKEGTVRMEPEPYTNGWGSTQTRNRYFYV